MSYESTFVCDEHDEIENWLESIQTQADIAALEQISINEQKQYHTMPLIDANDPLKNNFNHRTQNRSITHGVSSHKNKENYSKSHILSEINIQPPNTKHAFGGQVKHSKAFQDASSRTNRNGFQNSLSVNYCSIDDSNLRLSKQSKCPSFAADSPLPKSSLNEKSVDKRKHNKLQHISQYHGQVCMRREYNDLKVIRFKIKMSSSFLWRHFDAYRCFVKQRNRHRYKMTTLIQRTMTKNICHVVFRVWLMECMKTKFKSTQLIKMTRSRLLRHYFRRLRNQTSKLRQKAIVRIFFQIKFHMLHLKTHTHTHILCNTLQS